MVVKIVTRPPSRKEGASANPGGSEGVSGEFGISSEIFAMLKCDRSTFLSSIIDCSASVADHSHCHSNMVSTLNSSLIVLLVSLAGLQAFSPSIMGAIKLGQLTRGGTTATYHWATPSTTESTVSFIDTELRGAAMRLHTREQAPKEGQASAPASREPYTPTHDDYLHFLVDSLHVYEALEEIVNHRPELAMFRDTGLERTSALEQDIQFMIDEYNLQQPVVGEAGRSYASHLRSIDSIPEFMCHFYNFYFAHTAGGRMIGKQMAALLLDKRTLEFYKVSGRDGTAVCPWTPCSYPFL